MAARLTGWRSLRAQRLQQLAGLGRILDGQQPGQRDGGLLLGDERGRRSDQRTEQLLTVVDFALQLVDVRQRELGQRGVVGVAVVDHFLKSLGRARQVALIGRDRAQVVLCDGAFRGSAVSGGHVAERLNLGFGLILRVGEGSDCRIALGCGTDRCLVYFQGIRERLMPLHALVRPPREEAGHCQHSNHAYHGVTDGLRTMLGQVPYRVGDLGGKLVLLEFLAGESIHGSLWEILILAQGRRRKRVRGAGPGGGFSPRSGTLPILAGARLRRSCGLPSSRPRILRTRCRAW